MTNVILPTPEPRPTVAPAAENWDDDFELGISRGTDPHSDDRNVHGTSHATVTKANRKKQINADSETENWDDDYEDDNSSPVKSAPPLRRPSPENWDDSFEYDTPPVTPHKSARLQSRTLVGARVDVDGEFGEDDDDDEDEDKTVTRRPSSSRTLGGGPSPTDSPPPPVPAIPAFLQSMDMQMRSMLDSNELGTHLPPSPRQSLFSPSVLSHGSSGHDSTTHLFKTTSRPTRGLSKLPPSPPIHKERERRRLRKKVRPPGGAENVTGLRPTSPTMYLSEDDDVLEQQEMLPSDEDQTHTVPEPSVTPEPLAIASSLSIPSSPIKDKEKETSGLLSRGLGSVKRKLGRTGKKRVSTTPSEAALGENQGGLDTELDNILQQSAPLPHQQETQTKHSSWFFRSPSSAHPSPNSDAALPPSTSISTFGGNRAPTSSSPGSDVPETSHKLIKRKSFGFMPLGRGLMNGVEPDTAPGSSTSPLNEEPSEPFPSSATSSDDSHEHREGRKYGPIGLGWSPHRKHGKKTTSKRSSSRGDEQTPRKRSRSKSKHVEARKTDGSSESTQLSRGGGDDGKKAGWLENMRRLSFSSTHRPHVPRHERTVSGTSVNGTMAPNGVVGASVLPSGSPRRLPPNGSSRHSSSTGGSPSHIQPSISSSSSNGPSLFAPSQKPEVTEGTEHSALFSESFVHDKGIGNADVDDESMDDHSKLDPQMSRLSSAPPTASIAPSVSVPVLSTRSVPASTSIKNSVSDPNRISSSAIGTAFLHPHPPSTSGAASSTGGSLGRNAGGSATAAGTIKGRRNSLGDLKIPARISQAQSGLRRELGMVKEFKSVVDHLKDLQHTYTDLTKRIEEIIDACAVPPPPASYSDPKSGEANRAQFVTIANLTTPLEKTAGQPSPQRPNILPSRSLAASYTHLTTKYNIVWECAELLIELGGAGPGGAPSRSASGHRDGRERAVTLSSGVDERGRSPSPSAAFALETANSHGRASPGGGAGGGDLTVRQLALLKEILHPPPATLSSTSQQPEGFPVPSPSASSTTSHSQSSASHLALDRVFSLPPNSGFDPPPRLDVAIDIDEDIFGSRGDSGIPSFLSGEGINRDWRWGGTITAAVGQPAVFGSTITLPSTTTSDSNGPNGAIVDPGDVGGKKKKRVSRLVGFRDMLKALRRSGGKEGPATAGPSGQAGDKAELDHRGLPKEKDRTGTGGRRRSKTSVGFSAPWESVRSFTRPLSPFDTSTSSIKVTTTGVGSTSKSPRRPSLASIFKIGNSAAGRSTEGEGETNHSSSASSTEEEDWDRLDDVSPPSNPNSSATIRGKLPYLHATPHPSHSTSAPAQQQPSQHPYQSGGSGGTSRTSLHQGSRTSLHLQMRSTKLSDVKEWLGEDGKTPTKTVGKKSKGKTQRPGSAGSASQIPAFTPSSRPVPSSALSAVSKNKTGSVRSMPPPARGNHGDIFHLAMTPENIRPLLENAREVSKRLGECLEEVRALLNMDGAG